MTAHPRYILVLLSRHDAGVMYRPTTKETR